MRPTPRRVRAQQHAAYVRSNYVLVQDQERKQRVAYAPSRVRAGDGGAHPKPSEAPTHFGPPRAVRAACRNLVKHQRILGIPNLSATCGVRPLLAMSVRYLRCQSAIRNVRPQPAVSVRDRRSVGRACKNRHEHTLAKTVKNTRAGSVLFSIPGL